MRLEEYEKLAYDALTSGHYETAACLYLGLYEIAKLKSTDLQNAKRFHTCYPLESTDVEFQQDPAEHIKVQYHDEELTFRQLIDKLDEKTFECTRLKNIATAQKDEIIMLKRDLSAMEERLDG